MEDNHSIKVNGIVDIPSENNKCLNSVYSCNIREIDNSEKVNNESRVEGCKINIINQIYELKGEKNIFQCIVQQLSNETRNERMMYSGYRIIEKKNKNNIKTNNRNSVKAIKFNVDLKKIDYTFDYNTKIFRGYGTIYPNPKNICEADKTYKGIYCKVSKTSLSEKDYPTGSSVVGKTTYFDCDGTYYNANAVFSHPNYFSCCVYDGFDRIIAFGQVKTKYYDKDTDNNGDNGDANVTIAISGVAATVIMICCCIACCYCCCKNKMSHGVEFRSSSQPPYPPPPPHPYYNNYPPGYYPNNYYAQNHGYGGRNTSHSFHNNQSSSPSGKESADMVPI